eukprot:SAG22_NODE_1616_length_3986_cov_2.289169_3_plen_45_part_00
MERKEGHVLAHSLLAAEGGVGRGQHWELEEEEERAERVADRAEQ